MRCVYRLSLTATFPLYPDTSTSSGVGRSNSAVNPQPPLVFPARQRHCAALPSSFHPLAILTATFSHPQWLCRQPPKLPARLLSLSVCDATPAPGPDARCDVALTPFRLSANHFTHSESAYGLGQGQVGLLSAVQAPQQKACRSVPPRHLPFALILT